MTDWLKVVRDGLRGVGLSGAAGDSAPLDAVIRAYQGCPDPAAFSRAVADCLADPDAAVRGQALLFFERFPSAPGAEAVAKLPREQLAGVANPWMPGTDLEWQRLRSIGARAWLRDPQALAVAYEAALEPGRAQPLIAGLARADPAWVATHAAEIVRGNPDAAAALLINLQGSGQDVGAIGQRVAPLADAGFRGYIETFIDDQEVKRRILAALK